MLNSPVLLIIYDKPETTLRVLETIKSAAPKKLYIFADAPRENFPDEKTRCIETKKVIDSFDFSGIILIKKYLEINSGNARNGVSGAINWFFENEDEGIILESDCLPGKSFFNFTSTLLERYKDNPQIMHISGNNFQNKYLDENASYYFSNIPFIWGWATWKRAWKFYDVDIKSFPEFENKGTINKFFSNSKMRKYFMKKFNGVYEHKIDTWDYQWTYTILNNNGLCITPNLNLAQNIGFFKEALNTKVDYYGFSKFKINEIEKIILNDEYNVNLKADYKNFLKALSPNIFKKLIIKLRQFQN